MTFSRWRKGRSRWNSFEVNEWQWLLACTIVQGISGVPVANVDLIFGQVVLDLAWRALVVALVMAVLSPLMAELDSGGTA